jgi:hypothetical protein
LKCNINEKKLHTELSCLYVQSINKILNSKYKVEDTKEDENVAENNEKQKYKVEEAEKDENIIDLRMRLRNFLIESNLYDPNTIMPFITPI